MPAEAGSLPSGYRPEQFDGPLDLLFEEVRRQNVAIENIALAPVAARYLEFVQAAIDGGLHLDMEWLHMAATLILWKSRALLPAGAEQAPGADPIRDALIDQLRAYRRQVAGELARRRAFEEAHLSRPPAEPGAEGPAAEEPAEVTVWSLMEQARELAEWVEQRQADRRYWLVTVESDADDVPMAVMMEYLRGELEPAGIGFDLTAALEEQATTGRRVALLLGALEMVRGQEAEMEQAEAFGAIRMAGRSGEEAISR